MCRFSIRKMGIFGFKIEKRGNGEYEEKTVITSKKQSRKKM